MRSPDSGRSVLEGLLRVVSVFAMAALAVRFWVGAGRAQPEAIATTTTLDSALSVWSGAGPRNATLRASLIPEPRHRDWLVAIRRTGSRVSWSVEDPTAGALVIEPGPFPEQPARLAVLGKPRSHVLISDQLGRLDSVRIGADGAAWLRLRPLGMIRASLGPSSPTTVTQDSLLVRPLLVIGTAGWESKFVAAALEEDGWTVHARLRVAPGAVVRQGSPMTIDTGAFSAVVVLDSMSPLDAALISRFVNEGGGLVASGPGVRHPALRTLLPRQVGQEPGALGALFGPAPRLGLNARVMALRANQVAFERRNTGMIVVSALRVGSGRVVAAGYDDTWRLRMVPPDENAPRRHREWWSSLVGSAALTRLVPRDMPAVDEAPFAATVSALGAPIIPGDLPDGESPFPLDALLAASAAATLLTEWLSRRLRGVA